MSGIPNSLAVAAWIVTALAAVLIGWPLWVAAPRSDRRRLLALAVCMLPMNALALHGIRQPLDAWIGPALADWPVVRAWVGAWYAPLTEEPAKLWPFLLPWFARVADRGRVTRDALAVGLGFGIGEAWNVAGLLARYRPEIGALPWHALGGFMGERLVVCLLHAAFTAAALHLWRVRAAPARGWAAAILLHFVGNAPLTLAALGAFGMGRGGWAPWLSVWVLGFAAAMGVLLARIGLGERWAERLFRGRARCPGCGREYRRPWFRVNFVTRCLERCPHCRRWHWVPLFGGEAEGTDGTPGTRGVRGAGGARVRGRRGAR